MSNEKAEKILRMPDVKARTGLSRSTIYQRVADGSFPLPVNLGARSIGFIESEISAWIDGRIRSSRKTLEQARPVGAGSFAELVQTRP